MHQGLWKIAVCHESISGHSVWCAGRKCTVSGVSFLGIKARRVCTYALYGSPPIPVANDQKLCYGVQNNGGEIRIYNAVPEGYRIGDQGEFWAKGVLDQIRRQEIPVSCRSGINRLRIYSVTPGFVLEKLLIRPEGTDVPESYLGPKETYHT